MEVRIRWMADRCRCVLTNVRNLGGGFYERRDAKGNFKLTLIGLLGNSLA